MLDQNTDRMWYVIGAVLIGAAIILAANTMFPAMFDNITDSFQGLLDKGSGQIDDMTFTNPTADPDGTGAINLFSNLSNMPWI